MLGNQRLISGEVAIIEIRNHASVLLRLCSLLICAVRCSHYSFFHRKLFAEAEEEQKKVLKAIKNISLQENFLPFISVTCVQFVRFSVGP